MIHILGIVGGVASGKSFVAAELGRLGAFVIDADRVGHEVLLDSEVVAQARERWGDEIMDEQGQIVRPALADIVFSLPPHGPRELAYLEKLTHPKIAERMTTQIADAESRATTPVVALDASVLFKAGWDQKCTTIVFVDAPENIRLARAEARGWNKEEVVRREAAQWPLDEQLQAADFEIDASGASEATRDQVARLWAWLIANPPAAAHDGTSRFGY